MAALPADSMHYIEGLLYGCLLAQIIRQKYYFADYLA